MIGKLKDLLRLSGGEWLVSFVTREDPGKLFDELASQAVRVEISRASKHRSLNANAYAWVLIDKIAAAMHISETEVYRNAIRDIGGISRFYGVQEEAFDEFTAIWCDGHLGRQVDIIPGSTKPGWLNVKAYKGSSDFDSAQMARLIDLLVQDAEALGIATVPDKEVERMLSKWGKNPSSKKTDRDVSSAAG